MYSISYKIRYVGAFQLWRNSSVFYFTFDINYATDPILLLFSRKRNHCRSFKLPEVSRTDFELSFISDIKQNGCRLNILLEINSLNLDILFLLQKSMHYYVSIIKSEKNNNSTSKSYFLVIFCLKQINTLGFKQKIIITF